MLNSLKQWANKEMDEWYLVCPKCGNKKRIVDVGGVRLGGFSVGKSHLGYCSLCKRLRFLRAQRIPQADDTNRNSSS